MKPRIDLLTAMGALTLTSGLLAFAAFVLSGLAGILEDGALAVIELLFCAMMILYLLCSLVADNTCENKKFSLAAWGFIGLTALSGGFITSGQITFYEIIPVLLLGYLVLAIVSVVLTARGISGKGRERNTIPARIHPGTALYTAVFLGNFRLGRPNEHAALHTDRRSPVWHLRCPRFDLLSRPLKTYDLKHTVRLPVKLPHMQQFPRIVQMRGNCFVHRIQEIAAISDALNVKESVESSFSKNARISS